MKQIKKAKDPAQTVMDMLWFQYAPVEKRFIAEGIKMGFADIIKQYKTAQPAKKIQILDGYAKVLGL